MFCHLEDVNQIQKTRFLKIDAARRATQANWEVEIFKNRRRPQGNTLKIGNREFPKIEYNHRTAEQNTRPKNVVEHRTPEK